MRDFLGTIVKVIIVIASAIVIVNDIGAVAVTRWQAKERATVVIETAVETFNKTFSRKATEEAAQKAAQENGLLLKEEPTYSNNTIHLTVSTLPKRTIIVHRIKELEKFYLTIELSAKLK
ncbi:MAG: hypothetical protein Q8M92_04615 [Candidatus Subteraquimicrobiales bacterium]|nr:hypothetical protein [Candidatus Subteraquimicrobiales bacterium]